MKILNFMIFCFVIFAFILSFAGSLLAKKKKLSGFLQCGAKVRDSLSILLFAMFQICIGTSVDQVSSSPRNMFIFWVLETPRKKRRSLRQIVFVLFI
jgi:hypothetical protein